MGFREEGFFQVRSRKEGSLEMGFRQECSFEMRMAKQICPVPIWMGSKV